MNKLKIVDQKKIARLWLIIATSISFFSTISVAQQSHVTYQVQKNDTLSRILWHKFHLHPVYGKHGSIGKTIKLNKGRVFRSGDLIRTGSVLIIPVMKTAARKDVEANPSSELDNNLSHDKDNMDIKEVRKISSADSSARPVAQAPIKEEKVRPSLTAQDHPAVEEINKFPVAAAAKVDPTSACIEKVDGAGTSALHDIVGANPKEKYLRYKVLKGDILSLILWNKFKLHPVYGKHGSISKTIWLNKGRVLRSGDLIKPRDILLIPALSKEVLAYCEEHPADKIQTNIQYGSKQPEVKELRGISSEDSNSPSATELESEKKSLESAPKVEAEPVVQESPPPKAEPAVLATKKFSRIEPKEDDESGLASQFELSGGLYYVGLFGYESSSQTTVKLASDLTPSFELVWRQLWGEGTESRFFLGANLVHFKSDQYGNGIANSTLIDTNFGIGASTPITNRLTAGLDLEMAQDLFYTGLPGAVEVDQVPILRLHPEITTTLAKRKPFTISLLTGVSYYSAMAYGTYSIESGDGFDVGVMLSSNLKQHDVRCKLGYSERQQNTSLLIYNEKNIGLDCVFSIGQ